METIGLEEELVFRRYLRRPTRRRLSVVVKTFHGYAWALALRFAENEDDASDIAQELFLSLLLHPPAVGEVRSARGYLACRVLTLSSNMERSRQRRLVREARAIKKVAAENGLPPDDLQALREAIGCLPQRTRIAVEYRYFAGLRNREIAEILGVSERTVEDELRQGRDDLRTRLGGKAMACLAFLEQWHGAGPKAPPGLEANLLRIVQAGRVLQVPAAAALSGLTAKKILAVAALLIFLAGLGGWVALNRRGEAARQAAEKHTPTTVAANGSGNGIIEEKKAKEGDPAPAAAPEKKEEPMASVAGWVLDEEDAPIPFAEVLMTFHLDPYVSEDSLHWRSLNKVWIRRSWSLSATADESGSYRFDEVSLSGKATLSAFQEGFAGSTVEAVVEAGKSLEEVNLKLSLGKTLRGTVSGGDDRPVSDAIVAVTEAWNARERISGWGMAAVGDDGSFEVGVPAKAEFCDLRINSESLGQDFFLEVPVTGDEVRLKMKEGAVLRGRIAWDDGSPAGDVIVSLITFGQPYPEVAIKDNRETLAPLYRILVPPDAEGRYEIRDLQPGFEYTPQVFEGGPDRAKAHLFTSGKAFSFSPGEVKTWDAAIDRLIVVRGTVKTEVTGTPIGGARIGVRKDGKGIDPSGRTYADPTFEVIINTGPGRYLIFARPEFMEDEAADATFPSPLPPDGEISGAPKTVSGYYQSGPYVAERFGKTFDLVGGDEVEIDLLVSEPIVLPFRVIGADGKPIQWVNYELGFQTSDGRTFCYGRLAELDAEGRTSIKLHTAVKEMKLFVAPLPSGPRTEDHVFHPEPGTVLPEETFTIDRTCNVTGWLVDASGKLQAERSFTFEATYDDRPKDSSDIATDKEGRFELKGKLRARPMTLRIRGEDGGWKGVGLDASAGSLDLGQVVLDPARAVKR